MVCYGIGSTPGAYGIGRAAGGHDISFKPQANKKEGLPSLFGFGFNQKGASEVKGDITGTVSGTTRNVKQDMWQQYDSLTGTYIEMGHQKTETPTQDIIDGEVTGDVSGTVTGDVTGDMSYEAE